MNTPLHLILLAGGKGLRAGGDADVPKQFRPTGRGALYAVSLREFLTPGAARTWHLASITVTAPAAQQADVATELSQLKVNGHVASPGANRTASTWRATEVLAAAVVPGPDDLVAVHDAARPFATVKLLDDLARAAQTSGGAVPGVPVPDTIVQISGGAANYLQRENLLAVQTPQVFRWSIFASAQRWAHESGREFTDDGGLMAAQGHLPTVVPGESDNWKVTSAADWARAKNLLR